MPEETVKHRAMITACATGATVLQSLDQTIANVALPYMQGSFSASYDRDHTWVLTSYITAAAIVTALVGWLAARFRLQTAISRRHHWLHGQFDAVRGSPVAGTDRILPAVAGDVQRRSGAVVAGDLARHLPK